VSEQPDWMRGLSVRMPKPGEPYQVFMSGRMAEWFEGEVARRGWVLSPIPSREDDLPTVAVRPRDTR
jgi:hypothetical protein